MGGRDPGLKSSSVTGLEPGTTIQTDEHQAACKVGAAKLHMQTGLWVGRVFRSIYVPQKLVLAEDS